MYIVASGMTVMTCPDIAAAVAVARTYCRHATITAARIEYGDWRGKRRPVAHVEDGKVTMRTGWAWPTDDERSAILAA